MSKGRSVSNTVSNIRADEPPAPPSSDGLSGRANPRTLHTIVGGQIRGCETATGNASG